MKRKWMIFLLVGVLGHLVFYSPVVAQPRANRVNNVRRKYEIKKKFVEDAVALYGTPAARTELKKARVFEHQARQYFQARKRLKAAAMLEKANMHLDQAIQITLSQSGGQPFKKLDLKLHKAEIVVRSCQSQKAKDMLRRAKENGKRSRFLVSQSKYRQAFDLARTVYVQADQAIELCQDHPQDIHGQVLDEKERYERLLEKAEFTIEESRAEKANSQLAQARNEGDKGDRALRRRHYSQAMEFYYNASRLLWRVIEFSERRDGGALNNGYRQIERNIDLLNSSLSQLEYDLEGISSDDAVHYLEKAEFLWDEAEIALAQNKYRIAEKKVELAQKAIQLAYSYLNDRGIGTDERVGERDFQRLNEKTHKIRKDYRD
ncbi:hypothetical protein KAH55_03115, partial [bacterium]|nr:hypothetical protein [bacterium]